MGRCLAARGESPHGLRGTEKSAAESPRHREILTILCASESLWPNCSVSRRPCDFCHGLLARHCRYGLLGEATVATAIKATCSGTNSTRRPPTAFGWKPSSVPGTPRFTLGRRAMTAPTPGISRTSSRRAHRQSAAPRRRVQMPRWPAPDDGCGHPERRCPEHEDTEYHPDTLPRLNRMSNVAYKLTATMMSRSQRVTLNGVRGRARPVASQAHNHTMGTTTSTSSRVGVGNRSAGAMAAIINNSAGAIISAARLSVCLGTELTGCCRRWVYLRRRFGSTLENKPAGLWLVLSRGW